MADVQHHFQTYFFKDRTVNALLHATKRTSRSQKLFFTKKEHIFRVYLTYSVQIRPADTLLTPSDNTQNFEPAPADFKCTFIHIIYIYLPYRSVNSLRMLLNHRMALLADAVVFDVGEDNVAVGATFTLPFHLVLVQTKALVVVPL